MVLGDSMSKTIKAPWIKYYGDEKQHLEYPDFSAYKLIEYTASKHLNNDSYNYYGNKETYHEFLKQIDEALEKSFDGNYYFERVKKYFPNKWQLKRVETWGGEPFLHMDRIYPLVHQLINYYPYFEEMFSSTNFSYPEWIDQFLGLLNQFGKYPDRDFIYELQLSIDGPEYINDANRGEGVTRKCIDNYLKLLSAIKENKIPSNVQLIIGIKATLDINNIHQLNDKQKIIEYYKFFEKEFYEPFMSLNTQINFKYAHPNTATPAPATVEDGRIFAEVCKKCREIEQENKNKNYFKFYDDITFFSNGVEQTNLTYNYSHHFCGTGTNMIGFLPDNMMSLCHEGFTQFIEEYKKIAASSDRIETTSISFDKFLNEQKTMLCADDAGCDLFMDKMRMFENPKTKARLVNITNQILALAMSGQILECYLDHENALKAAIFMQSHSAYCLKDNYNKTGSFITIPNGMIKLLLNGAMQYIQGENELQLNEGGICNGECRGCQYYC